MENIKQEETQANLPPVSNTEAAIRHFQQSLGSGKHWYLCLLEAIGLWTDEVENIQGHSYFYLIEGEAFDWLLLAERLCETVDGKIPESEKLDLLFHNKPPLELSAEEFKNLIGSHKYHKYLNYFYGVTVEEALIQTVREEVRKEKLANCCTNHNGEENEVFLRIYGDSHDSLLKQFRKLKHYRLQSNSNLSELKQFTYWCFKYRVQVCEKAKVASDTQKGLTWLKKHAQHSHIQQILY